MDIKNIIFDLGGVILNINYHKTADAFKALGVANFDALYSQAQQSNLFDLLETGKISENDFRDQIKKITSVRLTYAQIDEAWNAMLLNLPSPRLRLLENLKSSGYQLFLLSNTNSIHYRAYTQNLKTEHNISGLEHFFHQTFFSHLIHQRKPHPETFKFVLQQAQINAHQTIFIDDSLQHVEGAKLAGIQAYHLQQELVDFFKTEFGIIA